MGLGDFLRRETIRIGPASADKWELIRELVALALAERAEEVGDPDLVTELVLARERQLSTGLERGIALPHGMVSAAFRPRAALAVLRDGIDFGSLDGEPTHFVALVLFPDDEAGRRTHIELLGSTIELLTRPELRAAMLAAATPQAALDLLRGA